MEGYNSSEDDCIDDDDQMERIIRKKVTLREDHFYVEQFYVKWSSGRHSWVSDDDLLDPQLLLQFEKEETKRSKKRFEHLAKEHQSHSKKMFLPPIEGSRFPISKYNKVQNYMDKLFNKPEKYTQKKNQNNYVYVPPQPVWTAPIYRSILYADSVINTLTLLWSEYEYEAKIVKHEEYVPTDIDFCESGLSVVEKKSRVLTLTSIACHYVARNLKKYPSAVWLPLSLKARIFIYLVKYRFSLIEQNLKEHLTFLLDPYLSTLDLSMFAYRITSDIAQYVSVRCQHLTSLKLGGCTSISDEDFENICRACTKLRVVDVSNCPQICYFNELTSGKFDLVSFSVSAMLSAHQFLTFIQLFSNLRVFHLINFQFVNSVPSLADWDVTAKCTRLVSLKISTKMKYSDKDVFLLFLTQNSFPELEILETEFLSTDAKAVALKSAIFNQPCHLLTSYTSINQNAELSRAFAQKFMNLKEIIIKNKSSGQRSSNFYFKDLIHHQIEILDLENVTLHETQDFLEFLLRPAAKHLKKISLHKCGWQYWIDQRDRAEAEVRDFLISWKPAPLPQLTHLSISNDDLRITRALVTHLFAEGCTNLTYLDLTAQEITTYQIDILFQRNPKIETVILVGCSINDHGVENLLLHCPDLSVLDLSGTSVGFGLFESIRIHKPNLWKLYLGCLSEMQSGLLKFMETCQDCLDHIYLCPCFWKVDTKGIDITLHFETECRADEFLGFSLFD